MYVDKEPVTMIGRGGYRVGGGVGRRSFSHTDEGDASKVLRYPNLGKLSLYYTMRWVCILVTSNVPKREKKTQPVFTQGVV